MNSSISIDIAFQCALILSIFVLFYWFPSAYVKLVSEDNWGEWAQFLGFFCAAIVFFVSFLSYQPKKKGVLYLILALGTMVVAMEEISWGQRIFKIPTPDILRQVNFQGELGFHNIRAISPEAMTYKVVGISFLIYGFVVPLLLQKFSTLRDHAERFGIPIPKLYTAPLFIGTCYFLGFATLPKSDEIGELLMSLSIGCFAVSCIGQKKCNE